MDLKSFTLRLALCLVIAGGSSLPNVARADDVKDFPSRPVHVLVGAAPGGSGDVLVRAIGNQLKQIWGQTLVVENVVGASGNIAYDKAAKSKPDGYTLVVAGDSFATNATLFKNLQYNAAKDFSGVVKAITAPQIMVVRPSLGVRTLQEYLAVAKQKRGELNFGVPLNGGIAHIATELMNQSAGVKVTYIPFTSGADAIIALLGKQIDALTLNIAPVAEHIRSGALVAVAVTSSYRSKAFPDIPTIAESGLPGFKVESWLGILAPADTPRPIIDKLNRDFVTVLNTPEMNTFLQNQGFVVDGGTPAEMDATIQADIKRYGEVIRAANITIQ